jgi:hypothetical protein
MVASFFDDRCQKHETGTPFPSSDRHSAQSFAGNVDINGNGVLNSNNQPSDFLLYGIQPPTNTSEYVNIGGNSQITASIYAPGHDVSVNGDGTNGHVYGSIVGKTVTMTGVSNLHYDERLG